MSQEIYIDVNYLTESERDTVLQVLSRDEELRRQEKRRIGSLKDELDSLRKRGATKEEKLSGKVCMRCREPFGIVFSSGALCPKCKDKVCKNCRNQLPQGTWICSLCARLREVRAESGAWFYEQISRKKGEKPKLYGSALLRASFRRSKPSSLDDTAGRKELESPPPPPVIKQELKKSGLQKPIPVHMSPLKEQAVEESTEDEVNSNYKPRIVPAVIPPADGEKQYAKAVPIAMDTRSDEEEGDKSSSSRSSRSATPTGVTTDDASYYEASEQLPSEAPVSVEVMNRKFNRQSGSSSESENEDVPTPRKPITNGSTVTNGLNETSQIYGGERKSGIEFENFLQSNLDQAFQSKESVADSLEGDKDGKLLVTGGFRDNEQQIGIEEWELNDEYANDYWLERKNSRSGNASVNRFENEKSEVTGERVSVRLPLNKQDEEKRKSDEEDGDLTKEGGIEDYWTERKRKRGDGLESKSNEHESKGHFTKAHRTVSWEYKRKDKDKEKRVLWKEIDISVEKDEEMEKESVDIDDINNLKEFDSLKMENYNTRPKATDINIKPKPGNVLVREIERLEPSVHWEAVEIDIEDFPTEKKEASKRFQEEDHEQMLGVQPDLATEKKLTVTENEKDVEENSDEEMEHGDEKERNINLRFTEDADKDTEEIERHAGGDILQDIQRDTKDMTSSENVETEMEEKSNEQPLLEIERDVFEKSVGKTEEGMGQAIVFEDKHNDEGNTGVVGEKGENIEFTSKAEEGDGSGRETEMKEELDDIPVEARDNDDEDKEPNKKRLSKRMRLLLEKRKETRQQNEISKDLEDDDEKKKKVKPSKEKENMPKRVRWKDIEDHIGDKYGDVILSEEESEERIVKHERMRKAELLLDRWEKKKQEREEQVDLEFGEELELQRKDEEEDLSETTSEEQEKKYEDEAAKQEMLEETHHDGETEDEYWKDRKKARADEHEGSGDFSYNYWQVRKKARVGRRGQKKDVNHAESQQNGFSQEDERRKMQLLRAESPDSATTGDFFTPRSTPRGSGDSTPVPSEQTSDDDSQYQMASSRPDITYDKYGVPILAAQTTDGKENWSSAQEIPAPPTIVTTEVTEEDDVVVHGRENDDDIDKAFATYGVDLNSKKLGEQFNMGSRESIASYYSDAGEGVYGNVAVTGSVQFGLKYDKRRTALEVQIHCAREIAAVDEKKQRSDPYIKVYLLPDRTKGGKRKTKTKKHTLNPVFDEILTFKLGFDELLARTLWLTVWNHDRFGHNEFLGEVMLPFKSYRESGFSFDDPTPQWYTLCERLPEPSLMTYCGELELALMFRPPEAIKDKKKKKKNKGELHIRLIGAKNLPAKDANGFSDPFCKSYLLPDKSKKTKQKTQIIKKNLNPVWNFSYVYDDLSREELMDRVLELTIWDHDRGSSNDFLGGTRLGLGKGTKDWDDAQGEEIEAWQAIFDHPSEWHKASITLRSKMDSRIA